SAHAERRAAAPAPPRLRHPARSACDPPRLRRDPRPARGRAGERMTAQGKTVDAIVVLVTAGSEDEGARIVRTLVEERLVACGNLVGPIRSIYRWEGTVEDTAEWLLVLK